jgi:hypothetical protein
LLQAVEQHDEGKRETFRIVQKELSFSYSFSGHRFRVPGNDPYIDALIRSHHAFSVEQINRERAKFEAESEEVAILPMIFICFAWRINWRQNWQSNALRTQAADCPARLWNSSRNK